ncbi:hypothetical protein [Shewanella sp. CG12_big_fil_rev_8_21_14_0_65_47_15]|uniref:hypothetical protein n=1 Tax=Shewanella sp. CG12_big_fil_rev_8_21_14_0_65_47_15 TaxID=1975537 RepID=UPI0025E2F7A4|nr:hypothetical protein [Shewanella sp. CG12_big_fil_rev_8_21_14_0_65_47_15]
MNIFSNLSGIFSLFAGVFTARSLEYLKFKQTICTPMLESVFKFIDEEINRQSIIYNSSLHRKYCNSLPAGTVHISAAKTDLLVLTSDKTILEMFEQFTRIVFYLSALRDGKTHHKGKDAYEMTNEGRELAGLLKKKLTKIA